VARTYAHRPIQAWGATPAVMVERHDHRYGPCDLPDVDVWQAAMRGRRSACDVDTGCRWDVDEHRIPRSCGCRMCTAHACRRVDRRRDRHAARAALADWTPETDDRVGAAVVPSW
jgi:hypothetical protein